MAWLRCLTAGAGSQPGSQTRAAASRARPAAAFGGANAVRKDIPATGAERSQPDRQVKRWKPTAISVRSPGIPA